MFDRKFFYFITALFFFFILPVSAVQANEEIKPLFNEVDPRPLMSEADIKPTAKLASASKISEYIEHTKGQKRVVYIYVSWCSACRKKMPKIKDMGNVRQGSVIAISVDENHAQFAKYMKKELSDAPFPILLSKDPEANLEKRLLTDYNIQPWNSYPELVLLDEANQVKKQGYLNSDEVARFLFSK